MCHCSPLLNRWLTVQKQTIKTELNFYSQGHMPNTTFYDTSMRQRMKVACYLHYDCSTDSTIFSLVISIGRRFYSFSFVFHYFFVSCCWYLLFLSSITWHIEKQNIALQKICHKIMNKKKNGWMIFIFFPHHFLFVGI